jgi:ribonuclease Y
MLNFIIICISLIVGYIVRFLYVKINIKSAEKKSDKIIKEAKILVMKKLKEVDYEIINKKKIIQNIENRLIQREENLDKKNDLLDKRDRNLIIKEKDFFVKEQFIVIETSNIKKIKEEQIKLLEKISKMTQEEAKKAMSDEMEREVKKDIAILSQRLEQEIRETAEIKSKEILSISIQKIAADHTIEITTSTVQIPNDEIKGRIIGREGRNIKTFEQVTGVDLIIDDTPESITLSSFDGIRRQIAKIALERLIVDGRIHPARIEEVVEKVKKEMDQHLKEVGEQAAIDVGIPGLNFEILKLLGKLKYRTSYGQNQLQHTLEVAWIAGAIAGELGLNITFCKKAGLLHDIGKAINHEVEGTHHQISANIAKKYGESPKMINAILSHHEGIEIPTSKEAFIVAAADAISAARPGARRESIEHYIKRLERLENLAKSFNGVLMAYAIQAGREIRILVEPSSINDEEAKILAHNIAKKIEFELEYPGQIKVVVIRETRAQDISK